MLNDFNQLVGNSYQRSLKPGKSFLLQAEGEVHPDLEIKYESVAESLYFHSISIHISGDRCMDDPTWATIYGLVATKAGCDRLGVSKRVEAWEINFNVGSYSGLIEISLVRPESLMDNTLYREKFENDEEGIPRYAITLI